MEEKRREPAAISSTAGDMSSSRDPATGSSRRRGGGQKRKATNSLSSPQSTPSKRFMREKALISNTNLLIHNGPLTRGRQGPDSTSTTVTAAAVKSEDDVAAAAAKSKKERAEDEELRKASEEWEALEAKIEAEFEVIRSRDTSVHVVPNHCGWFSWTKIHPLEERTLPSFFNGKSVTRSPDVYMEMRNYIINKFHENPNNVIDLKDLSELEIGDLEARQEIFEFLDFWGLINFHPFPPVDSAPSNADVVVPKNEAVLEKLYHFENVQSRPPVLSKPRLTTLSVPSGLFPESSIAEELVKQEGPDVEYHCNSCSADCSRKRYHCQKQADFDLCSDCFSNGKFGSGMSALDFILMEPAEGSGLSSGKWTDQETLLLLEALELYKENWNEIAEHVATKTKAQCILHFVQMPIEDTFLDYDDDVEPQQTAKEPEANKGESALETTEVKADAKTGDDDDQPQSSPMDISQPEAEVVVNKPPEESLKSENDSQVKVDQDTSKSNDNEMKVSVVNDENVALKALKEAFEAVGCASTPESPLSFAEAGNPVMALAVFLTRLVGPDVVNATAYNSLKVLAGHGQGTQLASRHCYILEDPPDAKKEKTSSVNPVAEKEVTNQEKDQEEKNHNEDKLVYKDTSNIQCDKKAEDSIPEENDDVKPDGVVAERKIDYINEPIEPDSSKDHENSNVKKSDESAPKSVPDDGISEKDEDVQVEASKSVEEDSEPLQLSKDVDMVSDSVAVGENESKEQKKSSSKDKTLQPVEAPKDVDMVASETVPTIQQPVTSHSETENGPTPVQNEDKGSGKEEDNGTKARGKQEDIERLKCAAVSALSAAAVKAKLLAQQEEEQIQMLTISLIEKQLQKLEFKLSFFNEMEGVVMRVREQLERSKQRLYHERAQIIAARLGLPPSSSRGMPPSIPTNRIATNFANSIQQRPPLGLASFRPLMSIPRPVGPPTGSTPILAGSSVPPTNQDNPSLVGTK
ncbi:hypothetical protein ACFE04_021756 [Oxalis oulophora]